MLMALFQRFWRWLTVISRTKRLMMDVSSSVGEVVMLGAGSIEHRELIYYTIQKSTTFEPPRSGPRRQHAQAPGGNRPQRGNRPRSSGERAGSPPAGAPRYTHGSYTRSNPQALGPRTSTSSNHGPSQSSWSIFLSPSAVLRHGAFDQRLRSATSRSSVRPSAIRTSKSSPSSSASTNAANAPSSTLT